MAKKHCEHCGAAMVEYKRNLCAGLGRCLTSLANAGGVNIDVSDLRLSAPDYSNFARLRFWGFIRKVENQDGTGKGGRWSLTERGFRFVSGEIDAPKYVITYRGEAIDELPERIMIQDVTEGWWYKPKVVRESRPHQMSIV